MPTAPAAVQTGILISFADAGTPDLENFAGNATDMTVNVQNTIVKTTHHAVAIPDALAPDPPEMGGETYVAGGFQNVEISFTMDIDTAVRPPQKGDTCAFDIQFPVTGTSITVGPEWTGNCKISALRYMIGIEETVKAEMTIRPIGVVDFDPAT